VEALLLYPPIVRSFAPGFALTLALACPAGAQTAANVLVVINEASPDSIRIGEYYAAKRGVRSDHVVRIQAPVADGLERGDYLRTIEVPIADWLSRYRLQDDVLYLVLTKGVPLRINGTGNRDGTLASVDSELTLLYRKLTGQPQSLVGRVENPYFLGDAPVAQAKPFLRARSDIYLVTRLDGFTADDAIALIDRGAAPETRGAIVLDEKATFMDRGGDRWLEDTANRLFEDHENASVLHESTRTVAATPDPVLGYYSWGSNDPSNQLRRFGLKFVPGAIGAMFVSSDGRTFAEPPADWEPSDPNGRGRLFAGSFQSLAGDLIRDGITGVAAHVAEPFLDATIRPQVLFPAYLAGFNLVESFYLAMPYLGWRTVVVGDPLCAPFARPDIAASELTHAIDPETELPPIFAGRRLAVLARGGLNAGAVKLLLKVESRLASDEEADVEPLLVEATGLEPRLLAAQLRLATLHEAREEYARAGERYRAILASAPQDVVALNNLAYLLATRQNLPAEALPLAQRAYRLAPGPLVADTLGWVHHLLGDHESALPLMERAIEAAPDNVDILVHAAAVHAALGDRPRAARTLESAKALDAAAGERADVLAIEAKIAAPPDRSRSSTTN
jgi:uncharacterized protein (TIGR03790 family)